MVTASGLCFNSRSPSWTALLILSVVVSHYVTLCDVVESSDCTPRVHLPCTVNKPFPYCSQTDISKYEGSPGRPTITDITPFDVPFRGYIHQGLNISWVGPDNDSLKSIKGFYLSLFVLSGTDVGKYLCRVFNLTTAQWTQDDVSNPPLFQHTIERLWHTEYILSVSIYSLPSSKWKNDTALINIRAASAASGDPASAHWVTYIVLRPSPNTLGIKFGLAKVSYGFHQYEVTMVDSTKEHFVKGPYIVNAPTNTYIFQDICPGNYYVWVRPYNPDHRNIERNSVCFKDVHKTYSSRCIWSEAAVNITGSDGCKSSPAPTPVVTTTPHTQTTVRPAGETSRKEPSTERPLVDGTTVLVVVVGIGVALTLLVIMALIYIRCSKGTDRSWRVNDKKKQESKTIMIIDPQCPNNGDQNHTDPLEAIKRNRKKVMIVYTKDCPAHCNVVLRLANFLQTWCYCDVILDIWCEDQLRNKPKADWLRDNLDLQKVHRIVIINSEGSFSLFQAAKTNLYYEKLEKDTEPIGDIFLPAIEIILENQEQVYDRYIMLHFDYTHESHCLSHYISTGLKYRLPDHLEDLFFHIHGINKHQPGNEKIVRNINSRDYCMQGREGELLYTAINEARTFVGDTPKWFYNLYNEPVAKLTLNTTGVPPLPEDHVDSGIDSELMPSTEGYQSVPNSPTFYPPSELLNATPGDMLGHDCFPSTYPMSDDGDMFVPPDVCILPSSVKFVQPDGISNFTSIINTLNTNNDEIVDPTEIQLQEPSCENVAYRNQCYKNDLDDTISDGGVSI